MTERSALPPGWYQHPGDPAVMRHWDGQEWTGHTAPTGSVEAARPLTSPDVPPIFQRGEGGLIAMGFFMAVLFPLAGIAIGAVLLFKKRLGPGLGCILLSIVMMLVIYALLAA